MNYITLALNILFFAFLGFGFLMGLKRGMKRTLVRTIWIILIVCLLIPISMNITSMILKINIPMSYGGQQCANIYEYLLTMFQDLIHVEGGNYSGLVDICIFLVSLVLNGLIYLLLYWIVKLLSLPLYWIINGFIFASERRKKRQAKKKKQKIKIKKHRFAGALIGTVLGLISFCMTITPVIGYVNLVNVVEKETQNEDGKGVLTQNIGDTYDQIMSAYNSSVPISAMNKIGMNKLLLTVFDGLTTSKISNKRIVLKDEAVSFSRIYNQASTMKMPDINTVSQDEFNTTLTSCDKLVELVFDSQLISATSDVIIPFGVAFARQSIDTSNFKPYVLAFYNVLFDEMEKLNSSSTEHEILSIIGLVKTLNNHNLLLPIIQTPEDLNVTYLQNHLTREASDEIVDSLFAISTVNNVAPALVNFLLGFGAEKLEYDYSSETAVTGEALKQSVSVLMGSVVDLLQNYDEGSSTKIKLNETTIGAVGGMLDEVKTILSVENFNSVVNALEPKLQDIAGSALSSSPEFMQNSVKEAIGNISEITSFKTTLLDVYDAVKVVENQFNDAKVNDKYDVQYMDFIKIGEAMDDIQNSGLFKDDLLLRTMEDAVEHFSVKVEDSVSTEEKPFELTVDTKIIANINELKGEGIEWQSELPKYKNTVGIFLNLFQTEDNLLEKLKSDADSTLEDLGVELDGDLKNSALFKDTDRLLVSDLLTLADIKVNSSEDEDLSTLLQDAKDNVLDESVAISWKDEFFHIKQLIKLEFEDTSDNSLLAIGEAIDKVTFDYDNGDRVVPKSTIFTQDMINKYISNYMDKVFENVTEESDFYSTINSIKSSFNTETITSYRLEIEALLKLKEVKSLVEESGFDFNSGEPKGAVRLGQKLDNAIELNSVVVDKALINDFITKKLDDYFTDYSDMNEELVQIKAGFNDDIEKYEVEFTALLRLMDISDVANNVNFDFKKKSDAITLGESIDTALGKVVVTDTDYTSKIVTRSLINGYIKDYISENITLSANNQFGDVIENIVGTETTDGRIDTMTNTYTVEFGYLSQLLVVSDAFTDITLSTLNDVNVSLNSTLSDQFDGNDGSNGRAVVNAPLRQSQLVGDSLLIAIDTALNTYKSDANNADYQDILNEVNSNYSSENGIRDNIRWAGNNSGQLYYTNLINAFVEIDNALNSNLTEDINSPTDLTAQLAGQYDSALYVLQGDGETIVGNILLSVNGTNKLTQFVLRKIRKVLEVEATFFAEEISYIDNYILLLCGYFPTDDGKEEVKRYYLPYGSDQEIIYAYLINAGEQVWGLETTNSHSGIQTNKPFTYLSGLIQAKAGV